MKNGCQLEGYGARVCASGVQNLTGFYSKKTTPVVLGQPFQGGIVALIFNPEEKGWVAGEIHGLIAAKSDQVPAKWESASRLSVTGATETALGTGGTNTTKIVNAQKTSYLPSNAAKLCKDYNGGGFTDWYLPAKDELNLLYQNKAAIGGFSNDYYYSSSETSLFSYWYLNFTNGQLINLVKSSNFKCRPVRLF